MSYGSISQEDPALDKTRFNIEACKLGVRGITLIIASGDDGVANFIARNDPSKCGISPSFPATSPYVTTVGATQGPEVIPKLYGYPLIIQSSLSLDNQKLHVLLQLEVLLQPEEDSLSFTLNPHINRMQFHTTCR